MIFRSGPPYLCTMSWWFSVNLVNSSITLPSVNWGGPTSEDNFFGSHGRPVLLVRHKNYLSKIVYICMDRVCLLIQNQNNNMYLTGKFDGENCSLNTWTGLKSFWWKTTKYQAQLMHKSREPFIRIFSFNSHSKLQINNIPIMYQVWAWGTLK